ncbi:MAG: 50S ribosomal protein L13 [Candidatus Colwellbacteria bacterium]|nr:50S ribosomal protein L13 [Candidatus Colwellbacteria bacterium]
MRQMTLDAKNKTLGRLSSEIARVLQGKDNPDFAPHKLADVKVTVKNAHLVKLTGAKVQKKVYYRHTGRPGHLKVTKYRDIFAKNPEWVVRHAVLGMLPKNRLRAKRIKLLTFEN